MKTINRGDKLPFEEILERLPPNMAKIIKEIYTESQAFIARRDVVNGLSSIHTLIGGFVWVNAQALYGIFFGNYGNFRVEITIEYPLGNVRETINLLDYYERNDFYQNVINKICKSLNIETIDEKDIQSSLIT